MITVKATREGLDGVKMATGIPVDKRLPFVALPSGAALRLWIWLLNPANQIKMKALVLDTGPYETRDHAYVFQAATFNEGILSPTTRPIAESGKASDGRITNGAGIDLGEYVRLVLGMPASQDNEQVSWWFA